MSNTPQALQDVLLSKGKIVERAVNWVLFLGFGILITSNSFKLRFLKAILVAVSWL